MKTSRITAFILAVMMILSAVTVPASAYYLPEPQVNKWDGRSSKKYQYGDGSKGNPYQIRTGAELKYFADKVNSGTTYEWKYFILVNDIDLGGAVWTPIGDDFPKDYNSDDVSFEGYFDGNGRTVSNFSINDTDDFTGFFGNAALGWIRNLHLNANTVQGRGYVGVLMGRAFHCEISGCTAVCKKVSGRTDVGGLLGGIEGATVSNCYANVGEITSQLRRAGAFTGWACDTDATSRERKVTNCLAVCNKVSCVQKVGGFIGEATEYAFENCFVVGTAPTFTGTDKSTYHAFAGCYKNSTFKNCAHTFPDLTDPIAPKKTVASLGMNNPGQWYTSADINGGVPYMKGWERVTYPFFDVAGGSWYADAVAFCYKKDYVSGQSYSRFAPDNYVTRAQFVQILAKIDGANLSNVKYESKFSDVSKGKWYTNAVLWAVDSGITGGIGYGKFGPDYAVTRAQLAAFMRTYAEKKGRDVSGKADLEKYRDSKKIPGWALEPLSWAVQSGIISGDNKGNLLPEQYATRAQVAVIVKSFCNKILAK